MTRGKLLVAVSVAALSVGASPAWAQRADRADPDSRASGPERTGTAVDRSSSSDSSSNGSSSSGGSSGSSASSPGSSSSGSSNNGAYSAPSSSAGPAAYEYVRAPQRPAREERAQGQGRARSGGDGDRAPGGNGGSARAVPRGESGGGSGSGSRAATPSGEGRADAEPSRRAVPTYSRPRDGSRQPTGTAVDRQYPSGRNGGVYSYPTYSTYYGRYYFPGYAFGLGYFHDPGWYDPYYYGGGYGGGGYGYGGGGAYGGGYQGGYGTSSYGRGPTGSLRLKIQPRDAQVYVDGYFVGVVDSFDGVFQRLAVDAGGHRIEIKSAGHEPISFDVLITPGETVTYKGELRRIR